MGKDYLYYDLDPHKEDTARRGQGGRWTIAASESDTDKKSRPKPSQIRHKKQEPNQDAADSKFNRGRGCIVQPSHPRLHRWDRSGDVEEEAEARLTELQATAPEVDEHRLGRFSHTRQPQQEHDIHDARRSITWKVSAIHQNGREADLSWGYQSNVTLVLDTFYRISWTWNTIRHSTISLQTWTSSSTTSSNSEAYVSFSRLLSASKAITNSYLNP